MLLDVTNSDKNLRENKTECGFDCKAWLKGGEDMDQKKAKEILGKQLELLAEVSKTCQPEELVEISEVMVLIAREF